MTLKVWFVASEVEPFRKTGGLADDTGALPKELKRRGVDVRVVMPLYQGIGWHSLEKLDGIVEIPMYYGKARAAVRLGRLPESDVPIYFVEHRGYFDRPGVYAVDGHDYADNLERFAFFSRASVELARALGFSPDVIHAHWPTALVSAYAENEATATVFTIHNLAHQGTFDWSAFPITALDREQRHVDRFEHFGETNLLKGALNASTRLTTVSPNYAHEILLPEYGFGLDGVLFSRVDDLHGVLNGIDTEDWDPWTDPNLPHRYNQAHLAGKRLCKRALQSEVGLPEREDVTLIQASSRLTSASTMLSRTASKRVRTFSSCRPVSSLVA